MPEIENATTLAPMTPEQFGLEALGASGGFLVGRAGGRFLGGLGRKPSLMAKILGLTGGTLGALAVQRRISGHPSSTSQIEEDIGVLPRTIGYGTAGVVGGSAAALALSLAMLGRRPIATLRHPISMIQSGGRLQSLGLRGGGLLGAGYGAYTGLKAEREKQSEELTPGQYLKEQAGSMIPAGIVAGGVGGVSAGLGFGLAGIPVGLLAGLLTRSVIQRQLAPQGVEPITEDIKALPRSLTYGTAIGAFLSALLKGKRGLAYGLAGGIPASALGHYESVKAQRAGRGWL